jgi:hypothetical protein
MKKGHFMAFHAHAIRANQLLTFLFSIRRMLVSHRKKFIVFEDPLGACPWIARSLQPWLDQPIMAERVRGAETPFFNGMSPDEAALAFDMQGLVFRDYARIAIIRNPYAKMAQLYYRIAMTDPVWRMRQHLGLHIPKFEHWLRHTRSTGRGAGYPGGTRWRKFGAWSADAWCGDHITHTVRASHAVGDLKEVFAGLGIAPAFGDRRVHELGAQRLSRLYDNESNKLIQKRYQSDLALLKSETTHLRLVRSAPKTTFLPGYKSVA